MKNYTAFLDNWQLEELGNPLGSVSRVLNEYHVEAFKYIYQKARKTVPFYMAYYKAINLPRIRSMEDIESIPFVTSGMLVKEGKRFLGVSLDDIKRVVTLNTSGTSGISKRVFFTDSDIERTILFFVTVLSNMIKSGEKGLVLLPAETPSSSGDLLGIALGRIGVKSLLNGIVKDFNETVDLILKNKPSLIIGLPVQVLILSELLKLRSCDNGFIKNVIVTSDSAAYAVKERIEENIGCSVYDHFGMTETGYGGAIDCFAHEGYHLREIDLFVEIIDPLTGKRVKNGAEGEIVITNLTNKGMPLIRYRTSDISSFLTDPCICGSPFRRLNFIKHRSSNLFDVDGVKLSMNELDSILFSEKAVVDYNASIKDLDGKYFMDISLSMIKGSDSTLKSAVDKLKNSPLLKEKFEKGIIEISSIKHEPFKPVNTYVTKRQLKIC